MGSHADNDEFLDGHRTKGALHERVRKTRGLPKAFRLRLLLKDPLSLAPGDAIAAWEARDAADAECRATWPRLSSEQRARTIRALLPHVSTEVEAGLAIMHRRPYSLGHLRRPFRCPRHSATVDAMRADWLIELSSAIGDFDRPAEWFAIHSSALASAPTSWLTAALLELGGARAREVVGSLAEIASGDVPHASMSRELIGGFLRSSNEEAWDAVARLLLAAQRQEGLRQAVLECVDFAHPDAFVRMLRVIREHDLERFAAVRRAAGVWFGHGPDASDDTARIKDFLGGVEVLVRDESTRRAALEGDAAEARFLGLWSAAFHDVEVALQDAAQCLASADVEHRYAAIHFLRMSQWPAAQDLLVSALGDGEIGIAAHALQGVKSPGDDGEAIALFDALESLRSRIGPTSISYPAMIWPWTAGTLERSLVVDRMLMCARGDSIDRLLDYVPDMSPWSRESAIARLAGLPAGERFADHPPDRLEPPRYDVILALLGDRSAGVRRTAFAALANTPVLKEEVERHIELLRRRSSDVRTHGLARLESLPDDAVAKVVARLMTERPRERRIAGLELARRASESSRCVDEMRRLAQAYKGHRKKLTDVELAHLEAIAATEDVVPSPDDAFGLIDPSLLETFDRPTGGAVELETEAMWRSVDELVELVLDSLVDEALVEDEWRGHEFDVALLRPATSPEELEKLWLVDRWRSWARGRTPDLRADDGLELVRAFLSDFDPELDGKHHVRVAGYRNSWGTNLVANFIKYLTPWLAYWEQPEDARAHALALDVATAALARVTERDLELLRAANSARFGLLNVDSVTRQALGRAGHFSTRMSQYRWMRDEFAADVPSELHVRAYRLSAYLEEHSNGHCIAPIDPSDFLSACQAGYFSDGRSQPEFIERLIGRRGSRQSENLWITRVSIDRRAGPGNATDPLAEFPELARARDRAVGRLIEVECARGDLPTGATAFVPHLGRLPGQEHFMRAVDALGELPLTRGAPYVPRGEALSRQDSLSVLIRLTSPSTDDDAAAFDEWARGLKDRRAFELAAYAPLWASSIERARRWPGLCDAVWWLRAHTLEGDESQARHAELWRAEIGLRSPLSAADLDDGAVDVDWFARARQRLGPSRWNDLFDCARFVSSNAGHRRAQLYSSAILGEHKLATALERIERTRHKDSVRVLGLIPLRRGRLRDRDILSRYERLSRFLTESRQFGAQRQASERRAVEIGLQNLARTAGYKDPLRLTWAMEREAVADLADGPATIAREGVKMTLDVSRDGLPTLSVTRKGKELKNLPRSHAKDPGFAALKARAADLRRQAARIRSALEEMMVRGDTFEVQELRNLLTHPILGPNLTRLVFAADRTGSMLGRVSAGAKALIDAHGASLVLDAECELRLAHPVDLYATGCWHEWQIACVDEELVQPIKQVFRELYVPTEDELRNGKRSARYAGHQLQPRKAAALLGKRRWVLHPEFGAARAFHGDDLVARVQFQETFYSPAELEGITLEDVWFSRRSELEPVSLDAVPPRLFSEAMRDLDLVVSVAHEGGVDPEASASTMEMRAALLRETCRVLKLDNVEVMENNAVIRGQRATYALHLGSARVRVVGSIALEIVAVHGQRRGRLFLPFADDDPRTAEVLSKAILLSRDDTIVDPNLLEQIARS